MPQEMLRNYAVEASDLLTRWRRGEDVQDALAHQLRHVSAGLTTLQAEVVTLREDKARLDWLEKERADLHCNMEGRWTIWDHDGQHDNGTSVREAIDAARKT